MRTRSATRAAGLSPGREHALPPPTRKRRAPKAKKESGESAAPSPGREASLSTIFYAFVPGASRAILLEWLYLFFLLLLLSTVVDQAPRTARKRVAEEDLPGRPPVRRCVEASSPTSTASKSGGAVRRLLAAAALPRRIWGFRKRLTPLSPIAESVETQNHILHADNHHETNLRRKRQRSTTTIARESNTPLTENNASGTSMEAPPRKRHKSTTSIAPQSNTPQFERKASPASLETPSNIASTVNHHETTNPIAPEINTSRSERKASHASLETPSNIASTIKHQEPTYPIVPEINTSRFERKASHASLENPSNIASTVEHHETTNPVTPKRKTRRHKRTRSPSPEEIPNPPGTSYGMWDKYFIVYPSDSESEEEEQEDTNVDVDMKDGTPTPDPATIRYPHNTSGVGVFCVNLDDVIEAAEKEEAEQAEREQAELAEKEQAELAENEQAELAEAEQAAVVPDALTKARALALKHKPETSSRLRFVERLSTSTVATDLNEEMGIQPQTEEDEVRAAVAAIPEADLLVFNFPRAPSPGVAQEEIWRAVTAAAAGTPSKEVLPLFG